MPKGKTLSLISGSNGKPRFVVAKRECSCNKCGHAILCGEKCAEIPKVGGAYTNWKRHCLACFRAVIEQTMSDINELKAGVEDQQATQVPTPTFPPKQEGLLPGF